MAFKVGDKVFVAVTGDTDPQRIQQMLDAEEVPGIITAIQKVWTAGDGREYLYALDSYEYLYPERNLRLYTAPQPKRYRVYREVEAMDERAARVAVIGIDLGKDSQFMVEEVK